MPLEIESLTYNFLPLTGGSTVPHFHYNPLHDTESIWWIASWILFSHRDKPIGSEEDLEDAKSQIQNIQLLFPRTLQSFNRFKHFTRPEIFRDALDTLPASFLEPAKQLEEARAVLITRYLQAEAGTEFDEVSLTGVHADFTGFMERAEAASQNIRLLSLNRMLYDAKLAGPAGDKGQTVDEGGRSSGKRGKTDKKGKGRVF
jgi:hypothetical protein